MSKLQDAVNNANDNGLAESSMVYQVWDDGEITLQKGGTLLWNRTLHSMKQAIGKIENYIDWPNTHGTHGYAFVCKNDAESIRELIRESIILDLKTK